MNFSDCIKPGGLGPWFENVEHNASQKKRKTLQTAEIF